MNRLFRFLKVLWRLLQELSDQSPYRRHLVRHRRAHSRREWQRFSDRQLEKKFVRPKCC